MSLNSQNGNDKTQFVVANNYIPARDYDTFPADFYQLGYET